MRKIQFCMELGLQIELYDDLTQIKLMLQIAQCFFIFRRGHTDYKLLPKILDNPPFCPLYILGIHLLLLFRSIECLNQILVGFLHSD